MNAWLARRAIVAIVVALWAGTVLAGEASVQTVDLPSDAVGRVLKYKVALPAGYEQSDRRYPVLYMLHGFSGNYTTWLQLGAPDLARTMELIVVLPDAGNSWYINWAPSDSGQKNRWEDMIVDELIPHVDKSYRTIGKREGRAICGLSMGGYGAVVLGLRHPEAFCSIGSHSGALSYAKGAAERLRKGESLRPAKEPSKEANLAVGIDDFDSQFERTPQGDPFVTPDDCAHYDPSRLVVDVPRETLPHIYLNCGTEDTFLPHTLEFVDVLVKNKIPFTYAQSPGEHNKAFWRRELHDAVTAQVSAIHRALRAAAQEPAVQESSAGANPQ